MGTGLFEWPRSKEAPTDDVGEMEDEASERSELVEVGERPVPRTRRPLARSEIFSSTRLRVLGEGRGEEEGSGRGGRGRLADS